MTGTKYKTEKRKARVGERILITNKHVREGRYKNGDVLKVDSSYVIGVFSEEDYGIWHSEYEVIVGEYTPAPNLDEMDYDELVTLVEDAMKALRTRSYKNGYDQGRFDAEIEAAHGTYEKSDQQKRDEVVAKAKSDVAFFIIKFLKSKNEFIINSKKRTVVALRKSSENGHVTSKGIAKCAPNDCYNVHIGKAIALRRALGLEVPAEYLNAPQPTEVRVGDVVRGRTAFSMDTYEETVGEIEDGKYKYIGGDFDYTEDADLVIIDDSRAGESE
ncbi:hypothetical protein [Bacillus sp. MZGC1]|uniref:hypothetical protein n=1 Tax=Bacillus sp. MZGC1 TaxID=2108543 RepID=UPI000D041345|nr:hypothetical protein [Bacillus sp. MZGC1]PRS47547.1 hypothetical protein C6Y06_18540 [Bacillus sp. MZGC1]